MFLYIFKIIIKLIMMSSRFDPGSTSVRPQNPWTSPFYDSMNGPDLKTLPRISAFYSHAFTYCCWCLVYLLALHLHSYCWTWSSFHSFFSFFLFFYLFGGETKVDVVEKLKPKGFFFFGASNECHGFFEEFHGLLTFLTPFLITFIDLHFQALGKSPLDSYFAIILLLIVAFQLALAILIRP